MRNCKRSKSTWATFKINIQKAFDKVSWIFLSQVLKTMGFLEHLRSLIMECIGTASAHILINGELTERFNLMAGLRQKS